MDRHPPIRASRDESTRSAVARYDRRTGSLRGSETMRQQVQTARRDATLVQDAEQIRVMGFPVLEALPSPQTPYQVTDPFILVTRHGSAHRRWWARTRSIPIRGFDNMWYVLSGSASTGHTTGSHGSIERAHLSEGSLLWLRTGRGAWHAESIGAEQVAQGLGDEEFRGVLFWVNPARKDKAAEPRALVLHREQIPVRHDGDATVRVLVGDGSNIQLGTPTRRRHLRLQSRASRRQGTRPAVAATGGADKQLHLLPQSALWGVARGLGVSQAKIDMLSAWWETRLYSPAERAALTYAEALTRIKDTTVDSEFQRYHDQLGRPLRRRREPRHHRRCHQHEHLDPPEAR